LVVRTSPVGPPGGQAAGMQAVLTGSLIGKTLYLLSIVKLYKLQFYSWDEHNYKFSNFVLSLPFAYGNLLRTHLLEASVILGRKKRESNHNHLQE
jgi:hypothetical protein